MSPTRPRRLCSKSGCTEIVSERFCDKHKKQDRQEQDKRRGTAHERGYTSRWAKASKGFLKRNPLCVRCLESEQVVRSEVTDHIVPHKGDMTLFWDRDNWQALCKRCHDTKTATEDGGFGRGGES